MIQYKTIEGKPSILGINEGSEILLKIENNIESVKIGSNDINIYEKQISISTENYGISNSLIGYKFNSPWMCLNEKNYSLYESSNEDSKIDLLKRILIGNVLSMSKGFQYNIEDKLQAFISLESCKINFKNQEMIGFKGEFLINFNIPDYLGIGKSVSRGFGEIQKTERLVFN